MSNASNTSATCARAKDSLPPPVLWGRAGERASRDSRGLTIDHPTALSLTLPQSTGGGNRILATADKTFSETLP